MPTFKIARFEVRPEARLEVERAIREFALYVGLELEDSSWVTYRERANPNRYISLISAEDEAADSRHRNDQGTADFVRILHPRLVGEVDLNEYVLVASSRGGLPP
jgi:quinol monooxygenase YgiN